MTDGIIQEVFKKYFNNHRTYRDLNEPRRKDLMDINELKTIERELIENIKREFQYCKPLLSLDKYTTLQKRLIGGNNE